MKISVQKICPYRIFHRLVTYHFHGGGTVSCYAHRRHEAWTCQYRHNGSNAFCRKKRGRLGAAFEDSPCGGLYGTVVSFAFSLTGGILAYLAMCIAVSRVGENQLWVTSVFGGFFHNIGQLCAAAVISGTWAVFSLLPYLIISGILTGTLNGLILQRLWKSPLRKYSIKR